MKITIEEEKGPSKVKVERHKITKAEINETKEKQNTDFLSQRRWW
jgi:hypothetical protein